MKKYSSPKIIAEIGCNHKGDFTIAKELVRLAKSCGATVAKFQKRDPKTLLSKQQYNSPHPAPENAYGSTYGEHREFLELSFEQHEALKKYCEKQKIKYSTSVWDIPSAQGVIALNPDFIKIPSATNTHFEMMDLLIKKYKGDIHVSLGMTTRKEEKEILAFFDINKALNRLVLYSCTSGYPVPEKDVCLLEIDRLKEAYGKDVKSIGFSGHHHGISLDIAAFALGATWIERHFTKDRTWKGTDHAASLEIPGMSKLCRDLKITFTALRYKKVEVLDIEMVQRKKLKTQASSKQK